jgi:hypothetical protein
MDIISRGYVLNVFFSARWEYLMFFLDVYILFTI